MKSGRGQERREELPPTEDVIRELTSQLNLLEKSDLDTIHGKGVVGDALQPEQLPPLSWIQIMGITDKCLVGETNIGHLVPFADILSVLHEPGAAFAFAIISDGRTVSCYLGVSQALVATLLSSLKGVWPGLAVRGQKPDFTPFVYGGVLTGHPMSFCRCSDLYAEQSLVTRLARGLYGRPFCYLGLYTSVPREETSRLLKACLNEYTRKSETENVVDANRMGRISYSYSDKRIGRYLEMLASWQEELTEGLNRGLWRGCLYYATRDMKTAQGVGNLIKGVFSDAESRLEPLRAIQVGGLGGLMDNGRLLRLPTGAAIHPIFGKPDQRKPEQACHDLLQTYLSASRLSVLYHLPQEELPGFFINSSVTFDTADRTVPQAGDIVLGNIAVDGAGLQQTTLPYRVRLDDLTRHGLVAGMTGSGKSTTNRHLLHCLRDKEIPFLILESAKKEYWRMAEGSGEFYCFTLGLSGPRAAPLALNPFEVPQGGLLQTHIDYLMSAFSAAFVMYPPMPYVLEASVYAVYEDYGWDVDENCNTRQLSAFPTLTDLYYKIDAIVEGLGYTDRVSGDIKAALKARINSLRMGGKGAMLDTAHSMPFEQLLLSEAVLELDDVGDDDVKAFMLAMVLIRIYEHYKAQGQESSSLKHVILIEEAHRLLSNEQAGGTDQPNVRRKAVDFFVNMLAEIRSYGQGILISDQIPTKLTPDVLKNTNLKICHRLVEAGERSAVGKSMNMSEEQISHLAVLNRGCAAVHAEGDNRPKLLSIPFRPEPDGPDRDAVLENTRKRCVRHATPAIQRTSLPGGSLCAACTCQCQYGQNATAAVQLLSLGTRGAKGYMEREFPLGLADFWRSQARSMQSRQYLYCLIRCAIGLFAPASSEKEKKNLFYRCVQEVNLILSQRSEYE